MHPPDCPDWEYEHHPQRALVTRHTATVLGSLVGGKLASLAFASDSRIGHQLVFRSVTPAGHDYFAGHYRGEAYRCLRFYEVTIPSDRRVGVVPDAVSFRMEELEKELRCGVLALDADRKHDDLEQLRYLVSFACHVFVAFLTIHPYANGNGHMGRLIVCSILGRYGFWPHRWTVDPKPPDPPYSDLIKLHRDGNTSPLEDYLFQMLDPRSP